MLISSIYKPAQYFGTYQAGKAHVSLCNSADSIGIAPITQVTHIVTFNGGGGGGHLM